ncbi:MAG: FHA domain-containing protein [Myxococcales bacterium]|nr:FHA domain-containing protein [Myxococcales bacterium]
MFTLIIEDKHGAIVDEYSFEDGEFIVGRSTQADIVLNADNVSRRHARLFTVDGRCFVEDLKAANGVWLNGKRIYNVTELPRSAQVRIGDFFLHIEGAAFARPMGSSCYARLVPMPGSAGELAEMTQPTVLVGRGKDCTVVLNDVSVSRIHGKFTQESSGRLLLEDLRSSNGTYVNDRRIDQQELQHGDRIRFGTVAFSVQFDGMPELDLNSEPAPAYVPPPRQAQAPLRPAPAPVHAPQPYQSQYNAYVLADPPSSPSFDPAYVPPPRSMLPQIAALSAILFFVVALIVVVAIGYEHLIAPKLDGGKPAPGQVTPAPRAAAAVAPTGDSPEARAATVEDGQFDELIGRGQDGIARRQWDEAETLFKKARKINPISTKPTEALNMIAMEKRAGARFAQAEEAFAKKDYATAIRQHKLIPKDSVYNADARAALDAIAGVLEIDGDAVCAAKDLVACQEKYSLALQTGFASPAVEQKYAKLLARGRSP